MTLALTACAFTQGTPMSRRLPKTLLLPLAFLTAAFGCGDEEPSASGQKELPVGDIVDDFKADGTPGGWGSALDCKPVPDLPRLSRPRITVSLNGLTLHLVDPDTGFDKVFPVGVGAIDSKAG